MENNSDGLFRNCPAGTPLPSPEREGRGGESPGESHFAGGLCACAECLRASSSEPGPRARHGKRTHALRKSMRLVGPVRLRRQCKAGKTYLRDPSEIETHTGVTAGLSWSCVLLVFLLGSLFCVFLRSSLCPPLLP